MAKKQNDFFFLILFAIIWIARPISYEDMRSRHSIYAQETVTRLKSSSISTQNDRFLFKLLADAGIFENQISYNRKTEDIFLNED
jgi:hypothetical protein